MISHCKMSSFVSIINDLYNDLQRVSSNNMEYQSSPPRAYCPPFLFLYTEIDDGYLNREHSTFQSFCDWGAGIGQAIRYTQRVFPAVTSYGVEKDANLIKYAEGKPHKPIHGNCLTFARTADINYTFNISWNPDFKENMFNRIIALMKPGQILIEAYDHDGILRNMVHSLPVTLLNPVKDLYPYTIVRKI